MAALMKCISPAIFTGFTTVKPSLTNNNVHLFYRRAKSCIKPTYNERYMSFGVQFKSFGQPLDVLERAELPDPAISKDSDVLLKILAAPINPADINLIQGTYGFKPELPAIAGLEGLGEVLDVGSGVKNLKKGDWVLLPGGTFGSWKTSGTCAERQLKKVSNKLDKITACTLTVNPPTAYLMLTEFLKLSPGETVIQNGANSGVGQAVIQIAKAMGLKTINIIRDRPNVSELVNDLKRLGADCVVTEEELRLPTMKETVKQMGAPRLALNCVGGKNCSDMLRVVANGAYCVTYGGMSKQPVSLSTTALIFNDIKAVGFWRTQWAKLNDGNEKDVSMLEYLTKIALEGKLLPPKHELNKLENFKEAVEKSMKGFTSTKQILVMD